MKYKMILISKANNKTNLIWIVKRTRLRLTLESQQRKVFQHTKQQLNTTSKQKTQPLY